MFYLSNVAIAVNISQPSVRIGGGLHALIHIYFLHGGSKSAKPHWDLNHNYPGSMPAWINPCRHGLLKNPKN